MNQFEGSPQLDPKDLWRSLKVRVNPCAGLMLDWLATNLGPLAVVVGPREPDGWRVGWQRAADFVADPDAALWGVLDWGTIYLRVEDADIPGDTQLVLDMAFGGDPLDGLFKEFRLVGMCRPYTGDDLELVQYAAQLEAWSAIQYAARRK